MVEHASEAVSTLRSLRLRAMLSQEELAYKAGVSPRTVRGIELGQVRPQPGTLRQLAEALELGPEARALLSEAPFRPAAAPRELPKVLAAFAGRDDHLDEVHTAVEGGAAVIAVHGMAGVGKTAFAVRVARDLAPRWPDGQMFIDLHGFAEAVPTPDPASVLTRVLRGLGATDRSLPSDIGELTARYRSVLADRRVILVFDNAVDAAQVEALLPGTPSSLVLATSRRDLSALAGAYAVPLEPPQEREAAAMLTAALAGRITEDEAVALADRCGRLPLAMGLAAARLRSRPQWRVQDLLARFTDDERRLDVFEMGHRGVAAALRSSYLELDTEQRRLLRRLALVPGDDVDVHAAAALCEADEHRASVLLESLVDVHLVETRTPGRYRLHDLVRLFASGLANGEDTARDRDDALARLFDVYLHFGYHAAARAVRDAPRFASGAAAHDLGLPGFADRDGALAWFRAERANLESAAAAAARAGLHERAWHLATAFGAFFMYHRDPAAHAAANDIALASARELQDTWKLAYALGDAGRRLGIEGRLRDGIGHLEEAVVLKRGLGERGDAALTLVNIGVLHRRSGRFAEALAVYEEALELAATTDDAMVAAIVGMNMVAPLIRLGRLDEAERRLAEAEERIDPEDDHNRNRVQVFRGALLRERGDAGGAATVHRACLDACLREGVQAGITATLIELGEDLSSLGRHAEAVERFEQAAAWSEDIADSSYERAARNGLGRALTAAGRAAEAIGHHERAAALAESQEDAYELAQARRGLAEARGREGSAG
ncbi:tetratricopeptide repeat protein [Glycomyces sp. A-F 0318]|uniref:ATP-binding protein n=1 Tax=Glycomyces amatae TaxID=2881355 RepID=UPI001E3C49C3|nr:tetratricopeptide repeat protein [Glycomyces amatae]MCD0447029.1 tetratricopeptide repeat protein [Glycomyces amatae]